VSTTIPQHFVEQFSENLRLLSQQTMSRLRNAVEVETGVVGEAVSKDLIGGKGVKPNRVTERHGDTPLNNTPHTRRWAYPERYDYVDLLDEADTTKLLADPTGKYLQVHAALMGRQIDEDIISALGGTAKAGKTANEDKALPSGQKIAHGSAGLTVDKLRQAKRILDQNEVDLMHPRFFVGSAEELEDLLGTTEVTSSDYNAVRALVHGEADTFLGFNMIWSERLTEASNVRKCYAFAMPAVCLFIWQEPSTMSSVRVDKRNANQLYSRGEWGAVRAEDEMVVEVSTQHT